ncbi:MAG: MerR family transcriptional regulator [Actinomycetota bacterium]|jgi:DNA-binding transcriptional MerR regulator|nr:MerR family transcriptional regulator [Actinomycetota bacterium]
MTGDMDEVDADLDEGFRGPQVCALVGITYRQLDYWARTGLLRPSIAEASGSGSQRRYSYRDVLELKVIKRLLDAGLKLRQARQAVQCLRDHLDADVSSAQLVLAGSRSVLAYSNGEVVDLLAGGQGVFNVLPLAGVVSELDAAIVGIPDRATPTTPTTRAGGARRSRAGERPGGDPGSPTADPTTRTPAAAGQ